MSETCQSCENLRLDVEAAAAKLAARMGSRVVCRECGRNYTSRPQPSTEPVAANVDAEPVAIEVWRKAAYDYGGMSIPGEGELRAAAVIASALEAARREEWKRGYMSGAYRPNWKDAPTSEELESLWQSEAKRRALKENTNG